MTVVDNFLSLTGCYLKFLSDVQRSITLGLPMFGQYKLGHSVGTALHSKCLLIKQVKLT